LPLAHLAQVNLRDPELQYEDWRAPLPRAGVLQIFHDLEATGDDAEDLAAGRWLVRHVAAPGRRPADAPTDLADAYRPRRPARQQLTWTFPSPLDLDLNDDDFERVENAYEHVMRTVTGDVFRRAVGDPVAHWPLLFGRSPEARAEAVDRLSDVLPNDDPEDYVLLLHIPGDGPYDGWFGDLGRLEFWIRQQDLRAGHLDRAWPLLRS
jgi:hypothetical protein